MSERFRSMHAWRRRDDPIYVYEVHATFRKIIPMTPMVFEYRQQLVAMTRRVRARDTIRAWQFMSVWLQYRSGIVFDPISLNIPFPKRIDTPTPPLDSAGPARPR